MADAELFLFLQGESNYMNSMEGSHLSCGTDSWSNLISVAHIASISVMIAATSLNVKK
jgi:hypothetical protein